MSPIPASRTTEYGNLLGTTGPVWADSRAQQPGRAARPGGASLRRGPASGARSGPRGGTTGRAPAGGRASSSFPTSTGNERPGQQAAPIDLATQRPRAWHVPEDMSRAALDVDGERGRSGAALRRRNGHELGMSRRTCLKRRVDGRERRRGARPIGGECRDSRGPKRSREGARARAPSANRATPARRCIAALRGPAVVRAAGATVRGGSRGERGADPRGAAASRSGRRRPATRSDLCGELAASFADVPRGR